MIEQPQKNPRSHYEYVCYSKWRQ